MSYDINISRDTRWSILLLLKLTAVGGVWFSPPFVCLSVFFLYDISKTDAAMITKLDREMFHHKS